MRKTKIAINGCGRIGRAFLKLALKNEKFEIVAVNDLGGLENIIYLLNYDTAYGKSRIQFTEKDGGISFGDKEIKYFSQKSPLDLPWKDLDIDVVVESTGVFTSYEKSKVHLEAGAKRVVITAPVKDNKNKEEEETPDYSKIEGKTILVGVNDQELKSCQISSNASCTTNAGSPVLEILRNTIGIEKAMLNTVHGYTATQRIVDGPNKKDFRKGRAGAQNIIPSTTGAAIATTKVITELDGKFDGISVRVPVISGSLLDITFISKKETSVEEINQILEKESKTPRWKGIFKTTFEPIVSSDIVGSTFASIVDLSFTRVVDGNLVKILTWYDNEVGYSNMLVKHIEKISEILE